MNCFPLKIVGIVVVVCCMSVNTPATLAVSMEPKQLAECFNIRPKSTIAPPADDKELTRRVRDTTQSLGMLPKDEKLADAMVAKIVKFSREYQSFLKTGQIRDVAFLSEFARDSTVSQVFARSDAAIMVYTATHDVKDAMLALELCPFLWELFARIQDDALPEIVARIVALAQAQELELSLGSHPIDPSFITCIRVGYKNITVALEKANAPEALLRAFFHQYAALKSVHKLPPGFVWEIAESILKPANRQMFVKTLLDDENLEAMKGIAGSSNTEFKAIVEEQVNLKLERVDKQREQLTNLLGELKASNGRKNESGHAADTGPATQLRAP